MSSLRNPLPPPPEPIATKHLPTFAQAMSESTGSVFGGSVYSPAASNFGSSLAMVHSLSPSPSPRERERYISGVDDGNSRYAIPTGDTSRSRKRKGKGRETSHSHSYRHDLGHFDESGLQQSTSMSSIYPTSAPIVQSSTPTQHSLRQHVPVSNSSLPAGASSGTYAVRKVAQFSDDFDHPAYSTSHSYPTRSTALHMQFENTSQPVDAFALTSAYLREYSAGFINGQEAAFGTRSFAQPPTATTQYSASQGLSRTNKRRDDLPDSLIYTAESAEGEVRGRGGQTLDSRSRSRSQSRSRPTSLSNNLASSSLVSPPTHSRRHLSVVSLPSSSGHSHPSPSFSLFSNIERPTHNSNRNSSSEAQGQQVGSPTPSIASSGRNLLSSFAQDPIAAAARRSPSGRTIESWGTVYSNAQSNSLISGLRGLPHIQGDAHDNASVRTRGTRETRFSVDFTESGERDSRRHSRTSELSGRSVRSDVDAGTRDSSPVRPVHSMVGVLPLDEHDTARQVDTTYPSIPASLNRTGLITDRDQPRSSTAMDRRIASDSTIRNYGSTRTSDQSSHGRTSQPSRPTDAQRIAASAGWTSSQSSVSSSRVTAEHPPQGSVVSRHRNRDREDRHRQYRSNRDDAVDHQQQTTAHRSQTSMGVSSSSAWLWDADSNVYPSPLPYSSSSHTHHEQLSPTSQPLTTQPALSTSANSSARSHRLNRHRNYNHGHSYSSTPSRPSLLSSDSLPSFPVSVESTDDERYPNVRSRASDNGRSTRAGNHDNDLSSDIANVTTPLQSFGNALGLELIATSNGIDAPSPVSRVSTQRFLRSWSNS